MAQMIIQSDSVNITQSIENKRSMFNNFANAWLVIFKAIAEGKTIQRVCSDGTGFGTEWLDIQDQSDIDFRLPTSCYRIKPREFKNFSVPWEYIDKRWNYATYNDFPGAGSKGLTLYESKPKFFDAEIVDGVACKAGWSSDEGLCTWIALIPVQEGVNETEWLACRYQKNVSTNNVGP